MYKNGSVEFGDLSTGDRSVTFYFEISDDIVAGRMRAWNKNETTLEVEKYVLVTKTRYSISDRGVLVYFENAITSCMITGSGEQLQNFIDFENAYFETATTLVAEGGIGASLAGNIMKDASGKFVPYIPGQVNYKDVTDDSFKFISLRKVNFEFDKAE